MRAHQLILVGAALAMASACGTLLELGSDDASASRPDAHVTDGMSGATGSDAGTDAGTDSAVDDGSIGDAHQDQEAGVACVAQLDAACGVASPCCDTVAGTCRNGVCACGEVTQSCSKQSQCCPGLGCSGGLCCGKTGAGCIVGDTTCCASIGCNGAEIGGFGQCP